MSNLHIGSAPAPYTHSLRVTFSLGAGQVTVVKALRVAMKAPAAPPSPPAKNGSGFWFEVRDKDGGLLYHRPIPHGGFDSIEVFDDPKSGAIRRVPTAKPNPQVELIIPDLPGATEFTLHGPERLADRRKPSAILDRRQMEHLRSLAQGAPGTFVNLEGKALCDARAPLDESAEARLVVVQRAGAAVDRYRKQP